MEGSGQVSDGRRRHRAQQVDVYTCGCQPRFQSCFEHIAGNSGVLANEDLAATALILGKDLARGPAQLEHEVGCNRILAYLATNTIRAEVLLCLLPVL